MHILKSTVILTAILLAHGLAAQQSRAVSVNSQIPFSRENMPISCDGDEKREGLDYRLVAHDHSWPTQQEFLQRLERIEKKAVKTRYRGGIYSQFEPKVYLKMTFFEDSSFGGTVVWPEYLSSYYIPKFNVVPSREFYDWVMQHPRGNAE